MTIDDAVKSFEPKYTPWGTPIGQLPIDIERLKHDMIVVYRAEMAGLNPMMDRMLDEYATEPTQYLQTEIHKRMQEAKTLCSDRTYEFYQHVYDEINQVRNEQR